MCIEKSIAASQLSIAPSKNTKKTILLNYRMLVLARFMLAILGGYVLAMSFSLFASVALATLQASDVLGITMLAFVLHIAAFVWVFMQSSLLKACMGVLIPSLFFYLAYLMLHGT